MQLWRNAWHLARQPGMAAMVGLGFAAGIPLLLIFGTLSIWLREAGIARATVTLFSWAALGYSFKYTWAPLVDTLAIPGLTRRLGRRRAWLLLAQIAVIAAIAFMASTDPAVGGNAAVGGLWPLALGAVLLGFAAATQDIVIDAWRIESAPPEMQAMLSAAYIAGYRLGMLVAGAGALKLVAWWNHGVDGYQYAGWAVAYWGMAAAMLIGVVTTLRIREPSGAHFEANPAAQRAPLLFAAAVAAFIAAFTLWPHAVPAPGADPLLNFVYQAGRLGWSLAAAMAAGWGLIQLRAVPLAMAKTLYWEPFADFLRRHGRYGALILLLVGSYRIADIVMGASANMFYVDMGYSKDQIADIAKTFGLVMSIVGGFAGGALALRWGLLSALWLGAWLAALTNVLFAALAWLHEPSSLALAAVIAADNLAAGLASAALVAYLSSLTSLAFTATQYALFSSMMTLLPKLLAGYAGAVVDSVGYAGFFIGSALLGVPVLVLIGILARAPSVAASSQLR